MGSKYPVAKPDAAADQAGSASPDSKSAASWATTPGVRRIMQGNKRRDTQPELLVRRLLHAHGFRYRVDLNLPPIPRRRADIVFTRARLAVFIDGCFWHGCTEHYRPPPTNSKYRQDKVEGNVARDRDTDQTLIDAGWNVLRYWAHESPDEVTKDIIHNLQSRHRF